MKKIKENLILTIILIVVLGTHLVSCDKLPGGDPVEPEVRPSVELSVTPEGVVPYGGSVDIRWTADENTNEVVVKINGVVKATSFGSASRSGALYLDHIFKDALVGIVATNVDLSTEVEKEVHVGDWTTSTFGLISYYPWRYKEFRLSSLKGEILLISPASENEKSWIFGYHKDGTLTYSNYPGVKNTWLVSSDNSIIIKGTSFKLKVTQNEMIISYQVIDSGELVWFDMIYEHASDTPTDPD